MPRAVLTSAALAEEVCGHLPDAAPHFRGLLARISLPPDLKNVALEAAVARAPGCNAIVDVERMILSAAQTLSLIHI